MTQEIVSLYKLRIHTMSKNYIHGNENMVEINHKEIKAIYGGSWLSYVLGYMTGTLLNIGDAYTSTPEGESVQKALRDFH